LPDRAILLGKIGMSVLYSWTMTLAGMAVALVTVNLMYGGGGLLMYSPDVLLVGVVLSALISVMVATVGTLISLRSATVRQAQQIISILLLVPWFAIMFGMQLIPADLKNSITASLGNLSVGGILILLDVAIAVIDVGLLAFAVYRFNRSKLAFN
jgi:ABC-2 type transport system permease protein